MSTMSPKERELAIRGSIPLLASYFQKHTGASPGIHQLVGQVDAGVAPDELLGLVQIRVVLARYATVSAHLTRSALHPTRKGRMVRTTASDFSHRGQIDAERFMLNKHRLYESPPTIPIVAQENSPDLPENQIAVHAAVRLRQALLALPVHRLPANSAERVQVEQALIHLRRLLSTAAWVTLQNRLRPLHLALREAGLRIAHRQVRDPCFQHVLEWWQQESGRRALTIDVDWGSIDWALYVKDFESKLFEIWGLENLIAALERIHGPAERRSMLTRDRHPIASWQIATGALHVWFQAGFTRLFGGASFKRTPRTKDRTASARDIPVIPDIAVAFDSDGAARRTILVDSKLRIRDHHPRDELNEMLGIIRQVPAAHRTHVDAVLFFHAPESEWYDTDSDPDEDTIIRMVGTSPAHDPGQINDVFDDLAEFVQERLNLSHPLRTIIG